MALRLITRSSRRRILLVTVIGGYGLSKPGRADAPPPTWHQQRMPEPHAFTVRRNIVRLRAVDRSRTWLNPEPALPSRFTPNAAASTASRPASLTIRIRPSVGRDGEGYIPESGEVKTGIFLMNGLDRQFADLPVGQSAERALDNPEPPSTREPDHTGQYGPVDNNLPPRNSWPSKAASAVWSYYAMN